MAPKYHPTPMSGGDRKALTKELGNARAMANILATRSAEMRAKGEATIQQADKLLCESWNERMWSDGEPIDPSPTIDQAVALVLDRRDDLVAQQMLTTSQMRTALAGDPAIRAHVEYAVQLLGKILLEEAPSLLGRALDRVPDVLVHYRWLTSR
jgi:hypothetical protein